MITFQLDNFEKHIDTAEKAFEGAGGKYSFLLGITLEVAQPAQQAFQKHIKGTKLQASAKK